MMVNGMDITILICAIALILAAILVIWQAKSACKVRFNL